MKKIIKGIFKYLSMSIGVGVVYGIIEYWINAEVDIKKIIISSIVYFIISCFFALITPRLRKLLGFKNEE